MFTHDSVLQDRVVHGLKIKPSGIYVDCTVGGGGHALSILAHLNEDGRLIAFDQDVDALLSAQKRLQAYKEQVTFIQANFRHMKDELIQLGIKNVDGILFDLGVSSPQFDRADRGFSCRVDDTIDMRMNQAQS